MKLYNAHKFAVEILDDELTDPEELAEWVAEAISLYCEVRCVTVDIVDFKENVISTDGFDVADA